MNFLVKKQATNFLIFELNFDVLPSEISFIEVTIFKNLRFQRSSLNETEALQKIDKLEMNFPFPQNLKLDGLEPENLYKFVFILKDDGLVFEQKIHGSTLHDENETLSGILEKKRFDKNQLPKVKGLSLSEIALKLFSEKQNSPNSITKRKEIKNNILNARKSKDINRFVNSEYKFCKPKELADLRKKRMMMVAESMELYDDIYEISKNYKDITLFKNEWFMGPFYMYDHNFSNFH